MNKKHKHMALIMELSKLREQNVKLIEALEYVKTHEYYDDPSPYEVAMKALASATESGLTPLGEV